VDWTFLGGSIANWSFVAFVMLGLFALLAVFYSISRAASSPELSENLSK
jgi:hypothetical protein